MPSLPIKRLPLGRISGIPFGVPQPGPLYGIAQPGPLYGIDQPGPLFGASQPGPLFGSAQVGPLWGAGSQDTYWVSMGWNPDRPDHRDQTLKNVSRKTLVTTRPFSSKIDPSHSDIRESLFRPIQNQGPLESCTAHAVAALLEYLQRMGSKQRDALSRLFLYNTTREYLGIVGDSGASIRGTIKTAALFGVPPEDKFPYILSNVTAEPAAFLYAFAANFKALNYTRLDDDSDPRAVLHNVKLAITSDLPVAFGFTVYSNTTTEADIAVPTDQDKPIGGHALLIIGYDDKHPVKGPKGTHQGAFKVRNSWGTAWGNNGYGWLPYEYVYQQLACDFWTCLKFA